MAEEATSKRRDTRPGISPLKSMSGHSTFFPLFFASNSIKSIFKPGRLPFFIKSKGRKGGIGGNADDADGLRRCQRRQQAETEGGEQADEVTVHDFLPEINSKR